jgi:hypothetical protein
MRFGFIRSHRIISLPAHVKADGLIRVNRYRLRICPAKVKVIGYPVWASQSAGRKIIGVDSFPIPQIAGGNGANKR